MDINCTTDETTNIIDHKKIEVLIITSIETLKHQKSKCGKDEVFKSVKRYYWENITWKIFYKTLDLLIEGGSVKSSLISNRTCLSLRKHNAIENSNLEWYFNNFKEDLIEEILKKYFLLKLHYLKINHYIYLKNAVDSPMMVLRHLTAHILEEVYFLQKQLKSKDEMINSLLSQLAKYNDMLQLQQSNQSSSLSSLSSSSSSPSPLSSSLSLTSLLSSSSSLSSLSPSSSSSSSSSSSDKIFDQDQKK